ncbi:TetR family transcriptional regulator C-terminal domain-containing protein [Streptomyces sp. NBC_00347]|uniref:TetR family transcriptional regulator C-terminal domain-containing protein n=1 Tax=Streptomyces sp. NBC_00347 TaxID=2975721 RepID=UPI00339043A5
MRSSAVGKDGRHDQGHQPLLDRAGVAILGQRDDRHSPTEVAPETDSAREAARIAAYTEGLTAHLYADPAGMPPDAALAALGDHLATRLLRPMPPPPSGPRRAPGVGPPRPINPRSRRRPHPWARW